MICQISLFISRLLLSLSIPKAKESSTVSTQARLFFRLGKHQKSPSVLPVDFADFADTETIESSTESEAIADLSADDLTDDPVASHQESLDLVDSGDVAEVGTDVIELDWDPIAQEQALDKTLDGTLDQDVLEDLSTDKPESVAAVQKTLTGEKEETTEVVVSGAEGVNGADGVDGADPVTSDPVPSNAVSAVEDTPEVVLANDAEEIIDSGVDDGAGDAIVDAPNLDIDDGAGDAIADNQAPTDLADETLDTLEDQDVVKTGEEESDPVVNIADDVNAVDAVADDIEKVADAESKESEQEELEILGDSLDTEPNLLSQVESGYYTVDATGKVEFTFVFDSGAYEGQLAAISMTGMENLDLNSPEFFREALQRALYGSEAKLGYIVIDDINDGAMFGGELETGADYNHGEFAGTTIVEFRAGDKFFLMLIPNGSVAEVEAALEAGTTKDVRPLFSLVAANPTKAIQMGQIIDVTGDGNTYVFEDIRQDGASDKDFNDLIFQVKGATIKTVTLDELILEGEMSPEADWRNTEIGQQIVDYAASQVVIAPEPNPVEKYEFPKEDQPLLGFIDTHFTQGNPDIDYSRIILGKDYIQNDSDPTVAAVAGEGTHGDHILGIVAATQDNGVGIDGINDDATLWVSSAVESGKWADALVEFVDAAIASNQPNAIINLSIDLTQVNPDGSVTTRYEFTPQERGAIEYARQNGVLIVAAAGNDGSTMSALGQASLEFDNILSVGSGNISGRYDYSSYGVALDLIADGGTINQPVVSTVGEDVNAMSGTSVATAKATGAASQVWAANPELSYLQVKEILINSATDLQSPGWNFETGAGLLNLSAAVALAKTTPPLPHIPTPLYFPGTWSGEGTLLPKERSVSNWANVITSGRRLYNGWLNDSDSSDTFNFSVGSSSPLQIGVGPEVNLTIRGNGINRSGNFIRFGIDGEPLLPAGSYTITADKNYSGRVEYTLRLNFNSSGDGSDRINGEYDKPEPQSPTPPSPIPQPPQPEPPPLPPKPSRVSYTVRPTRQGDTGGDTLWSIAARLLGDGNRWKEISKDVDGTQFFLESEVRKPQSGNPTLVFLPSGSSDPLNPVPGNNYYAKGILVQQTDGRQSFYDKGNGGTPNKQSNQPIEIPAPIVDETKNWKAEIIKWTSMPSNFHGDLQKQFLQSKSRVVDLNSNLRKDLSLNQDGTFRKGLKLDSTFSSLSPGLSSEKVLIKAITKDNFQAGATYTFMGRGNDGYQVWAKNITTGEWFPITPRDKWQTNPIATEYKFNPTQSGEYYIAAYYYNNTGETEFGLNWRMTSPPTNSGSDGGPITSDAQFIKRLYGNSKGVITQYPHANHQAIDSVNQGLSPYNVYALASGVIKRMTTDQHGGIYIDIWNEQLERTFRYLHFKSFNPNLKPGMTVKSGDFIGIEGNTGNSGGRHTHFAIVANGKEEDPWPTLNKIPNNSSVIPPNLSISVGEGLVNVNNIAKFQAAYKARITDKNVGGVNAIGPAFQSDNGWIQEFQKDNHKFVLTLRDGSSEAFWLMGDNRKEYDRLSAKNINLGYAQSNEAPVNNRPDATVQTFATKDGRISRIYHSPKTGSVAVWGDIGAKYDNLGGSSSWLGLPTKAEWNETDGITIWSQFEGGRIAFNTKTGDIKLLPEYSKVLNYMADEFSNNSKNELVDKMKDRNELSSIAPGGGAIFKIQAYTLWKDLVGTGKVWDHKPKVLAKSQQQKWVVDNNSNPPKYYKYESWSNMHYGYIGRLAGFSELELLQGAGLAQIPTNGSNPIFGSNPNASFFDPSSIDDPQDQSAIKEGFKLYDKYPRSISKDEFLEFLATSQLHKTYGTLWS